MNKIVRVREAIIIAEKLHKQNKTVVVVGGCFDILHIGHIKFLQKAKKQGDVLFVLLESDETIRRIKGPDRPIHTQKDRAGVLSSLNSIDYIVLLPFLKTNNEYDDLLLRIKPTIIATTKGDQGRIHKERQAKLLHVEVVDIMKRIPSSSTSKLAKLLSLDL